MMEYVKLLFRQFSEIDNKEISTTRLEKFVKSALQSIRMQLLHKKYALIPM